jgi:hypothetical protein
MKQNEEHHLISLLVLALILLPGCKLQQETPTDFDNVTYINTVTGSEISADYYYSVKMNAGSELIKSRAIENIAEFEKSEDYQILKNYYVHYGEEDNLTLYYVAAIISNYYWVRDNIIFAPHNRTQDALTTLKTRSGQCDEQALLMAALLRSVGLDGRVVITKGILHAYTAVRWDGFTASKFPGVTLNHNGQDYIVMDTTCTECETGVMPQSDIDHAARILKYYE